MPNPSAPTSPDHEPARIPRPPAEPGGRRTRPPGPPRIRGPRNHPPRHAVQPLRRRQTHPPHPLSGGRALHLRRQRGRHRGRLLARTHPHLFADPRRPAGARQRRLPPRQAHQPQSLRRRHGHPGRRFAAHPRLPGARRTLRAGRPQGTPHRRTGHRRGHRGRHDRRAGGRSRRRRQNAHRPAARIHPPRQDRGPAARQPAHGRYLRRAPPTSSTLRSPATASTSAWPSRLSTTFWTSRSPPQRSERPPARTPQQHKITFPAVYGLERSHRMAEEECALAHRAIAPFGDRAARLRELADHIVQRKS